MAHLYEIDRWRCRYNGGLNSHYPCRHKGCTHKLRNGRCGLEMCRLETDERGTLTGACLDFNKRLRQERS